MENRKMEPHACIPMVDIFFYDLIPVQVMKTCITPLTKLSY